MPIFGNVPRGAIGVTVGLPDSTQLPFPWAWKFHKNMEFPFFENCNIHGKAGGLRNLRPEIADS
jgi:hypothetical protein